MYKVVLPGYASIVSRLRSECVAHRQRILESHFSLFEQLDDYFEFNVTGLNLALRLSSRVNLKTEPI